MGRFPIKCISLSSKQENIVVQFQLKLNGEPAKGETWHLKTRMVKVDQ